MSGDEIREEDRRARFERWEQLGLDQVKADLQTGGHRVIGGPPSVRRLAWEWVRTKEGQQAMKRDMNLIRELLLRLEDFPLEQGAVAVLQGDEVELAVPGRSRAEVEYHLSLLRDDGLIDSPGSQPMIGVTFRSLSPRGHDLLDRIRDSVTTNVTDAARSRSKVFIVHGHDNAAREAVARFIEKLGFEAIILHERPNKGRTIITKFREEAVGVGFAVVLMTPDDMGGPAPFIATRLRSRARQNVVFELGFFIGELGPDRVAALVKGDIERPSDFDGVVYISLDSANWQMELGRELKAAGYVIDWNKVMG